METYAERLQKEKKDKMTNYDMDQLRREGKVPVKYPDLQKRKEFAEDIIDSEELPKGSTNIDIEITNRDLLHLAKAAHDRDITLNQLCIDVLKSAFDDLDYRFEHSSKPVVLSEY